MKDELKEIIIDILEASDIMNVKPSSEMVLDCATRIYISNKISSERQIPQRESSSPQSSPPVEKPLAEPPTEKQAFFLNKHGLNPAHFNKKTAHAKIGELMKK